MKKFGFVILSFLLGVSVFAADVKGLFEVVTVTPENIEKTIGALEKGKNYSIVFEDDFDFSKISQDYFQYILVDEIHKLFESGSYLKFSGPFDYIYFSDIQSVNNFSVIKTMLNDAPEKKFCVDISHSYYEMDSENYFYQLPVNCFSDHENLYWVNFGDFVSEDIPEGTCSNLPNLQAVFFHGEDEIKYRAFDNVNENCLYINSSTKEMELLSEYVDAKKRLQKEVRDYRDFGSSYEFDPYSGVTWLVDGDNEYSSAWWDDYDYDYDYDSDDDSEDNEDDYYDLEADEDALIELYMNLAYVSIKDELIWDKEFEQSEELTKKKAKTYSKKVDRQDYESVALAFMSAMIYGTSDPDNYICESPSEEFETGVDKNHQTISSYEKITKIFLLREWSEIDSEDENQAIASFGIDYEENGETEKDVIILSLVYENDIWAVEQVQNSMLKAILLNSMLSF